MEFIWYIGIYFSTNMSLLRSFGLFWDGGFYYDVIPTGLKRAQNFMPQPITCYVFVYIGRMRYAPTNIESRWDKSIRNYELGMWWFKMFFIVL